MSAAWRDHGRTVPACPACRRRSFSTGVSGQVTSADSARAPWITVGMCAQTIRGHRQAGKTPPTAKPADSRWTAITRSAPAGYHIVSPAGTTCPAPALARSARPAGCCGVRMAAVLMGPRASWRPESGLELRGCRSSALVYQTARRLLRLVERRGADRSRGLFACLRRFPDVSPRCRGGAPRFRVIGRFPAWSAAGASPPR
jgi:hypothetical protein